MIPPQKALTLNGKPTHIVRVMPVCERWYTLLQTKEEWHICLYLKIRDYYL